MTNHLMDTTALSGRTTWVFDLDNTLYAPDVQLFDEIRSRMTAYVVRELSVSEAEADRLRGHYWSTYGTTLAGLMAEHGIDPGPFLVDVHDVSMADLNPDKALRRAIAELPGRRIVYTNATSAYAERVLSARGLSGLFDAIYGVEEADYHPKPRREAFDRIFALDGLTPATAVMFEDDVRNLKVPHDIGMATVHVAPEPEPADHIHFHTDNLTQFLSALPIARKIG